MLAGAALAGPEPVLARLVRGCIGHRLGLHCWRACVPSMLMPLRAASSACYVALAIEREHTTYRSPQMLAGAVLARPGPMHACLIRGCI